MRNNEEVFSIIKKIAEREGYPISYIINNIKYYTDKYGTNISNKEMDNLHYHLKTKVTFNEFTSLKLVRT